MFKLVGVQGSLFYIEDTDDGSVDVLAKGKVCKCLNLGIDIGGVTRVDNDSFEYNDMYFPEPEPEISSEADDWEDDPYASDYDSEDISDHNDTDENQYNDYDSFDDEDEDDSSYLDPYNYTDEDSEDSEDSGESYGGDEEDDYYGFDDPYADEGEEEVSTVNKLYSHLNEEQIKVLKRYYLWYSQRIFDEGRKNRTLRVTNNPRKLQKQKELNAMRNEGGLWAYAGFIDMGYRGADYCTLGHPLRYVHLAWDTTQSDIENSFFGENYSNDIEEVINSTSCIKFGIECISDFFEIDKEYTDRLRKAQREALKDMDFMCEYYEKGLEFDVINSFGVLDNIMNKVNIVDAKGLLTKGNSYKPIVPKSLTAFYLQFRKEKMVLPKSLIQEIRDNLIGWGSHKFIGWREPDMDILHDHLKLIVGKGIDNVFELMQGNKFKSQFSYNVYNYLVDFFQLKSCGYYEYDAETFKDEGGASKAVKSKLRSITSCTKRNFWADVEFSLEFLKKLCEYADLVLRIGDIVDGFKVPCIAYDEENRWHLDMNRMVIDSESLMFFDNNNNTELNIILSDLVTAYKCTSTICKIDYSTRRNLSEYLDDLNNKVEQSVPYIDVYQGYALGHFQHICDSKNKELEDNSKYVMEEEEDHHHLDNTISEPVANTGNEISISGEPTDTEVLEYCIANADQVKGDRKLKFALSVLDTVSKTGKYSDKQMHYIKQIYSALSGVSVEDKYITNKVSLDSRKDIEDAIDIVIANPTIISKTENREKVLAILQSIKKYRRISEKQMKYAEIALDVVTTKGYLNK